MGAAAFIWRWATRRRGAQVEPPEDLPYTVLKPADLLRNLPSFGRETTEYVAREETAEIRDHPLTHPFVLLVGQSASGKTRETAKIAEIIAGDVGPRARIYLMRRAEIPPKTPPDLRDHIPVLLFDDLDHPWRNQTQGDVQKATDTFRRIAEIAQWYAQNGNDNRCWVLANARNEPLERVCRDAVCAQACGTFERVELGPVMGDTEYEYWRSALRAFGLQAGEAIVRRLVEENDGAFRLPYDFARGIAAAGRKRLNEQDIEQFMAFREQTWQEAQSRMSERQRDLCRAMGDLASLGVPLFPELILDLCLPRRLEEYAGGRLLWWREGRGLPAELRSLTRRHFPVGEDGRLLPHASRLPEPARRPDTPVGRTRRPDTLVGPEQLAPEIGGLLINRACRKDLSQEDISGLREALAGMDETLYGTDLLRLLYLVNRTRAALSLPDDRLRRQEIEERRNEAEDLRRSLRKEDGQPWADAQDSLGIAYWKLPVGDRALNLERCIECYERALQVCTKEAFPADWAMTQSNLGAAWWDLPTGDRAENIRNAIECYERALQVRTKEGCPREWAMTQNNLGNAWAELPTGDRAQNITEAIECYERALKVRTKETFPADWATTQNNLGNAWRNLPTGNRAENIQKAIACFERALEVRTKEALPQYWATTQFNLGLAHKDMPEGDRKENLQRAVEHFENTLTVWTEEAFPHYHARARDALERVRAALRELGT